MCPLTVTSRRGGTETPKHRHSLSDCKGFAVSRESEGETSAGTIRAAGCFASGEQLPGHFAGLAFSEHREAHHPSGAQGFQQAASVAVIAEHGVS